MEIEDTKKVAKSCKNFFCNICNYNTIRKSSYDKHLLTAKHKWKQMETKSCEYLEKVAKKYSCDKCQKTFSNHSGLWKHNKNYICTNNTVKSQYNIEQQTYINNNMNITPELVLELIKNNNELTNTINNLVKNGITNNTNNITNNSHNNTFNLQIFLNETCKDAMNIMDFVDSIKLQLSDLERIGEIGYTQGISDIITTNLQALDVTQRPVHCTDKKREIIYVKDENQWIKEENSKPKIRKMIKHIENKNIQVLPQFREKYPNYADPHSHDSDKYNKTIIEAMGGIGDNETKENKIIRNISKVITVREKE